MPVVHFHFFVLPEFSLDGVVRGIVGLTDVEMTFSLLLDRKPGLIIGRFEKRFKKLYFSFLLGCVMLDYG